MWLSACILMGLALVGQLGRHCCMAFICMIFVQQKPAIMWHVQVCKIVVGKQGSVIGEVGIRARRELEELFQNRVHLFLDVMVRP